MDGEVKEYKEDWENSPLGVLSYQLIESLVGHIIRNDLGIDLWSSFFETFKLLKNLFLEFSNVWLLVQFSVGKRGVADSVYIEWESKLLEGAHVLNSSILLIDQDFVLN